MYTILALGYEFLSQFLPFLAVYVYLNRKISWRRSALPILFSFYIIAVYHVTGVGTLYDLLRFHPGFLLGRVNLIPFSRDINWTGYLLNIVMFIPFGAFAAILCCKRSDFLKVLFSSLGLSLLIELSQLLCLRGTDVDDLIMNTTGGILGWIVCRSAMHLANRDFSVMGENVRTYGVYILVLFLGRFFLFHQLGFINLYYGF